jgi:hypothetical protein
VVAGDITLAKASQLATAQFGTWKGAKPAGLPAMTGPRRVASGTVLVHIPGATEATVLVGGPALAGPDSAFYEAAVLTRLLDDPGAGRLAHAFQAHPAWSGETGASLVRNSGMGIIQLSAAVPGEIADSALLALRAAARQVASTNPAVAELNRAREYVSGTFALRFQTASQLAVGQAESRLMELPASYISTFRPRTMAVTAARVRAVARRLLPDSGLVVVVAGDAVKLYPRLAKLGPIQLIGADGRRLDLQAIQPRSVPFALDMTRYSPRLDSLAIVADGRVVGAQVMTLERAGDTLRFRDRSAVGGATQQVTTVVLDTMGHARRVDLAAAGREGQTKISLSYAPGRVTGRTEYPGANGPRVTTIDQAITAGVIDESALAGILPLLAWELNNRWSFEVFSARENRVQNLTLTVADLTQVTVPAGEFECYRGDLEGGNQRISYYVTRQAPYRIVRIEIAGAPVELVAINR